MSLASTGPARCPRWKSPLGVGGENVTLTCRCSLIRRAFLLQPVDGDEGQRLGVAGIGDDVVVVVRDVDHVAHLDGALLVTDSHGAGAADEDERLVGGVAVLLAGLVRPDGHQRAVPRWHHHAFPRVDPAQVAVVLPGLAVLDLGSDVHGGSPLGWGYCKAKRRSITCGSNDSDGTLNGPLKVASLEPASTGSVDHISR